MKVNLFTSLLRSANYFSNLRFDCIALPFLALMILC